MSQPHSPYQNFQAPAKQPQVFQKKRKGMPGWAWALIGIGGFFLLVCGGLFSVLVYIGTVAPETSVYSGNQVPEKYLKVMRSVEALDEGETIQYFYSDGLTDIRDGFYFVSDQSVVVYNQNASQPLDKVRFQEIATAEIMRDDSFFLDSEITLTLRDGRVIFFPVSSEFERDKLFLEEINKRIR